jgi:hypothetical protein
MGKNKIASIFFFKKIGNRTWNFNAPSQGIAKKTCGSQSVLVNYLLFLN